MEFFKSFKWETPAMFEQNPSMRDYEDDQYENFEEITLLERSQDSLRNAIHLFFEEHEALPLHKFDFATLQAIIYFEYPYEWAKNYRPDSLREPFRQMGAINRLTVEEYEDKISKIPRHQLESLIEHDILPAEAESAHFPIMLMLMGVLDSVTIGFLSFRDLLGFYRAYGFLGTEFDQATRKNMEKFVLSQQVEILEMPDLPHELLDLASKTSQNRFRVLKPLANGEWETEYGEIVPYSAEANPIGSPIGESEFFGQPPYYSHQGDKYPIRHPYTQRATIGRILSPSEIPYPLEEVEEVD